MMPFNDTYADRFASHANQSERARRLVADYSTSRRNVESSKHPHEPEKDPVWDHEGRCLVCVEDYLTQCLVATEARAVRAEEAQLDAEQDAEGFKRLLAISDRAIETLAIPGEIIGWRCGNDEEMGIPAHILKPRPCPGWTGCIDTPIRLNRDAYPAKEK